MPAPFNITWEAPEFELREKDVSWYWISIIVASVIIAFAVWQKNFLFGFFIVIAEILFVLWGNQTPRAVPFTITEKGIDIDYGRKFYPLALLESYSVNPLDDDWTELIFLFRSKVKTPLKIIFPENSLEEFRKNLKTTLKEVEHQPTLLDSIERLIGF
jgi:hypothetical protein